MDQGILLELLITWRAFTRTFLVYLRIVFTYWVQLMKH